MTPTQRARELLAAKFERDNYDNLAAEVRAALTAALAD